MRGGGWRRGRRAYPSSLGRLDGGTGREMWQQQGGIGWRRRRIHNHCQIPGYYSLQEWIHRKRKAPHSAQRFCFCFVRPAFRAALKTWLNISSFAKTNRFRAVVPCLNQKLLLIHVGFDATREFLELCAFVCFCFWVIKIKRVKLNEGMVLSHKSVFAERRGGITGVAFPFDPENTRGGPAVA
jgi:hypothetical protein